MGTFCFLTSKHQSVLSYSLIIRSSFPDVHIQGSCNLVLKTEERWDCAAKASSACLPQTVQVTGFAQTTSLLPLMIGFPLLWWADRSTAAEAFLLRVSLCWVSLVWDTDSYGDKWVEAVQTPAEYSWVFLCDIMIANYILLKGLYTLLTSNRDCCRSLLYLCNQAMINYDAELKRIIIT